MDANIRTAYVKSIKGGTRWQGIIRYETAADGRRTEMTKVFDREKVKTRAQAEKALRKWRDEMRVTLAADQPAEPPADAAATVPEYVERVTMQRAAAEKLEQSTRYNYRFALNHIRDGFAGVTLAALKPSDVSAWIAGMSDRGLSPATISKAYRLLRQALDAAADDGTIPENPAAKRTVKLPKARREEPNVLDAAGRARIMGKLADAERTPPVLAAYIAMFTGMRRGEICALTWADVDADAAQIAVTKTIGIKQGGTYLKPPKSDRGRRAVPIPSPLMPILAAHKLAMFAEWDALMDAAGVPHDEADFSKIYVLGTIDGAYPNPTRLGKAWQALAESWGIDGTQGETVTLHDLRHTYATVAVGGNADVKSVSANLGHATTAITLDIYAADDAEAKRRTAETVARAFTAPDGRAE